MSLLNRSVADTTLSLDGGGSSATVPLLEVRDLRVEFHLPRGVTLAVDEVSYTIRAGRTVAIIGESGSGKTVGARALMGLLPESARVTGSVRFVGEELTGLSDREMRRKRGSEIAMVFQDPARSLNPTMRVGEQIREGIQAHLSMKRSAARDRAIELLEMVRLPSPRHRYYEYPGQLSGGMRQRAMIAMALSCNPRLLIADEATTALDVTTQAQILELLLELQDGLGMTLLLISHDLGLAASYTDEVIVMYAGRIVEQAPTAQLFEDVRMPYTKALLESIPRIDRPPHALLPVVEGRPPVLSRESVGCAFAPRCGYAQNRCHAESPALEEDADQHRWACWFPLSDEALSR